MEHTPKEIVEKLRKEYLPGTVVELVSMTDPYTKIPVGTQGVVRFVDDMGTVFVRWQTGSGLGVVYGVDEIKKIEKH